MSFKHTITDAAAVQGVNEISQQYEKSYAKNAKVEKEKKSFLGLVSIFRPKEPLLQNTNQASKSSSQNTEIDSDYNKDVSRIRKP